MKNFDDNFCCISDTNVGSDIEDIIEDTTDEVAKLTTTVQQL